MKKVFKKFFLLFFGFVFISLFVQTNVFGLPGTKGKAQDVKISIIIPVYNTEKYLDECLSSAENQTYKNLEIVCVNDGSTDDSLKILKEHAKKDSRIVIVNQKNQGLSTARNVGMDKSTGEYIYFLDSDDLILPHAIEKILETSKKYDADVVSAKNILFKFDKKINILDYEYKNLDSKVHELKKRKNPFSFFHLSNTVWNKLYKRSFLVDNNIRFKKGIIMEDILFTWNVKSCLKKSVTDNNVYYCYRVTRPGSIMNSEFKDLKRRLDSDIVIVNEFAKVRNKVDFKNKDNYIAKKILSPLHKIIVVKLDGDSEQSKYAKKAVYLVEKNFIKKYKIKLNKENRKKFNDLKKLAKR